MYFIIVSDTQIPKQSAIEFLSFLWIILWRVSAVDEDVLFSKIIVKIPNLAKYYENKKTILNNSDNSLLKNTILMKQLYPLNLKLP